MCKSRSKIVKLTASNRQLESLLRVFCLGDPVRGLCSRLLRRVANPLWTMHVISDHESEYLTRTPQVTAVRGPLTVRTVLWRTRVGGPKSWRIRVVYEDNWVLTFRPSQADEALCISPRDMTTGSNVIRAWSEILRELINSRLSENNKRLHVARSAQG